MRFVVKKFLSSLFIAASLSLLFTVSAYAVNNPPRALVISPINVQIKTAIPIPVMTSYSDPDGFQDIEYSIFLISDGSKQAACYYNQTQDKVYLLNDAGNGWLG